MPYHPHPFIIICTSSILSIDYNVLLYYNVTEMIICAEKWRKAVIYYYYR